MLEGLMAAWHRLTVSVRMGAFIFAVCLAAILSNGAETGWAALAVASLAAVAVGLWARPLEAVIEAAHELVSEETGKELARRDESELRFLARAVRELSSALNTSRNQLEARNLELEQANEVLEQLSITDGLTRLHNHRHFQDRYHSEARRSVRTGHPLCLTLIDIDDFKSFNDTYGHTIGDRVLSSVAQVMHAEIRGTDYLARYGGEEFAMLIPETPLEGAVALAEKLRMAVSQHSLEVCQDSLAGTQPEQVSVTVSVGVALFNGDLEQTFHFADRALYRAKAEGKDCVVVHDGDDEGDDS